MMKKFYYTFGMDNPNKGKCQIIEASCELYARAKMFEMHGRDWCTSYDSELWKKMKNDPNRCYRLEEELPDIITVSDDEANKLIDSGIFLK